MSDFNLFKEKIIDNSKVIKSLFDEEDEKNEDYNYMYKNIINILLTQKSIDKLYKFYSSNFNFTEDELVNIIYNFNKLDNIYLDESIFLYKFLNFDMSKLFFIPIEYINQFTVNDIKKIKKYNKQILFCIKYNFNLLLPWIYKKNPINLKKYIKIACQLNQLKILKLLYYLDKHSKKPIDFLKHLPELIKFSNDSLKIIKWIYYKGLELISHDFIDLYNSIFFEHICKNGYIISAQWLYLNFNIFIHNDNETPFRAICEYGYLNLAIWIYGIGDQNINIHANNDEAFRYACRNGHFEIVKWLYKIGIETHSPIDIHTNNEEAFRYACIYEHLNIAKFIYQKGIDTRSRIYIYADDNYLFKFSSREIKNWLSMLN